MSRFDFICDAQESNEIDGEGVELHCHRCQTTVHDLSALTRDDAAALLDGQVGPLCGRLRLDAELQPIFAPPRSPVRGLVAVSAALVGAAGIAAMVLAPPPGAAETSGPRPGAGVLGGPDGQAMGEGGVKSRLDLLIADAVSRARGEAVDDRPRHASTDGLPDDGLTPEERADGALEEWRGAHRPQAVRAGPIPKRRFDGMIASPAYQLDVYREPLPVGGPAGQQARPMGRPMPMPVKYSRTTKR